VRVDGVADSGAYLVYAYRVTNSRESLGGTAIISLDVSAPRGTGFPTLPATGRFMHGAGFPNADLRRFRDHVPVGAISPANWMTFLTRDATLDWFGTHGGFEGDVDSIAPGDSLVGLALRSPYLPGIRQSWGTPTFRSCCTQPRAPGRSSEPENPNPSEFKISGWTVGPTVRPQDLTLATVRADLRQACGPLHWITDGAICGRLQSQLASATLRAFVDEVEAQHGAGKPVNDNAYWLLKVNAEYLLAHM